MNISSVGHPGHRDGLSNQVAAKQIEETRPAATETADDAASSRTTEAASRHSDGPKGVIGLLQGGHFKGVAAVRLSINFHEQLSSLNREATGTRLDGSASRLDGQVAAALEDLPEGASDKQVQLVTDAQEGFSLAIRTAVKGFRNGESSQDETLSGMQTAFNKLMLTLEASFAAKAPAADASGADEQVMDEESDILIAAVDETSDAGQVTVEGVVGESVEVPDTTPSRYMATIGQVFNSLMEDLQSELDTISAIPEFTAPNGNGVAFEKFMAIYRDLAGLGVSAGISTVPEAGIDTMPEESVELQV